MKDKVAATNHSRLSKSAEIVLVLIFMMFILTPMIGEYVGPTSAKSVLVNERREVVTFPKLARSIAEVRKYPGKIEDYVNDRFGFRSTLVSMNSMAQLMIGTSSSDRVLVGRDGWFFLHQYERINVVDQYRGLEAINDSSIDRWLRPILENRDRLAEKGVALVVASVPNKHTIYPEFLPSWVTQVGPTSLDLIVKHVKANTDLAFVDMRKALIEAKSKYQESLWYKKDTHWNYRGSFIGYSEIMKGVRRFFPELPAIQQVDVTIVNRKERVRGVQIDDLSRMLGLNHAGGEPWVALKFRNPLHIQEVKVIEKNGERVGEIEDTVNGRKLTVVSTSLTGRPRAMIIRDSTGNAMAPYFRETFSATAFVHVEHIKSGLDPGFFRWFNPDIVIVSTIERNLLALPQHNRRLLCEIDRRAY